MENDIIWKGEVGTPDDGDGDDSFFTHSRGRDLIAAAAALAKSV